MKKIATLLVALLALTPMVSFAELITTTNFDTANVSYAYGYHQTDRQKADQSFTTILGGTTGSSTLFQYRQGNPVGDVTITIEADSGGNPSGTPLASGTVLHGNITSCVGQPFTLTATTLAPATTYWLVYKDTTDGDTVNYYTNCGESANGNGQHTGFLDTSTWTQDANITSKIALDLTSSGGGAAAVVPTKFVAQWW